jgi:hypothetical protein
MTDSSPAIAGGRGGNEIKRWIASDTHIPLATLRHHGASTSSRSFNQLGPTYLYIVERPCFFQIAAVAQHFLKSTAVRYVVQCERKEILQT